MAASAAESVELRQRNDLHVIRKLWHIFAGLTGLSIYFFSGLSIEFITYTLLTIGGLSFILELLRLRFAQMNEFVIKVMGPFMRESERSSFSGLPFYALGVGLSLLFFSERIAILAIFFLVFADPISSYFGVMFGEDKITPNKSLQGSVAGFVTCFLISLFYGLYYAGPNFSLLAFSCFAGLIGTASELLSELVDDNLSIPVASGVGLTFLNLFIPLF